VALQRASSPVHNRSCCRQRCKCVAHRQPKTCISSHPLTRSLPLTR
jgi:hypothetical protein